MTHAYLSSNKAKLTLESF